MSPPNPMRPALVALALLLAGCSSDPSSSDPFKSANSAKVEALEREVAQMKEQLATTTLPPTTVPTTSPPPTAAPTTVPPTTAKPKVVPTCTIGTQRNPVVGSGNEVRISSNQPNAAVKVARRGEFTSNRGATFTRTDGAGFAVTTVHYPPHEQAGETYLIQAFVPDDGRAAPTCEMRTKTREP